MAGDVVVLVHGLWMNGLEFGVLGHRLRSEHGFDVRTFSYPTLQGDVGSICAELADYAESAAGDRRVHLVGHSLGGVLVYRTLSECGAGRISGNAVLLGSPLNGSRAARGASRWSVLRPLLGPHVLGELAEPCGRCWTGRNALGAIAGTLRMGTGQFFAHFDEDNDGTVGVSETIIPGLAGHLVLPHSHVGMLFAAEVARQVAAFLREGRFSVPAASAASDGTGSR
jgi:pimeloyl-ACP methyl ester carboxylesterase